MSKFKISAKPPVPAETPGSIQEFGNAAPMVKAQTGGRGIKPVRLNLDLDPATHKRLKLAAIEAGVPVAVLVRQWIDNGLSI
jgi:hypothetical protein